MTAGKGGCTKRKRGGAACDGARVKGSNPPACRMHLGKRSQDVKAEYDLAERARKLVGSTEPVVVTDVIAQHLELAGEMLTWLATLRELVRQEETVGYQHRTGEQVRASVKLYTAALQDCNRALTDIGKLGLERRQVEVNEANAARLQAILSIALLQLGMSVSDDRVAEALRAAIAKTAPRALPGVLR